MLSSRCRLGRVALSSRDPVALSSRRPVVLGAVAPHRSAVLAVILRRYVFFDSASDVVEHHLPALTKELGEVGREVHTA